jgi:hypothetical protein
MRNSSYSSNSTQCEWESNTDNDDQTTFWEFIATSNFMELAFPMIPIMIHSTAFITSSAALTLTTALPLIISGTFLVLAIGKIIIEKIEAKAIDKYINNNAEFPIKLEKTLSKTSFAHGIYKSLYIASSIASFGLLSLPAYMNAGTNLAPAIAFGVLDLINTKRVAWDYSLNNFKKSTKDNFIKNIIKNRNSRRNYINSRQSMTDHTLQENEQKENFKYSIITKTWKNAIFQGNFRERIKKELKAVMNI